jgi:hypothetical protein
VTTPQLRSPVTCRCSRVKRRVRPLHADNGDGCEDLSNPMAAAIDQLLLLAGGFGTSRWLLVGS